MHLKFYEGGAVDEWSKASANSVRGLRAWSEEPGIESLLGNHCVPAKKVSLSKSKVAEFNTTA